MADSQDYNEGDQAGRRLREIVSPAEAQSLVLPPPSLPISRPAETATRARSGLSGYFATAKPGPPDRSADRGYIKISSRGAVGYLPKANLQAAMQIDKNLKVLD